MFQYFCFPLPHSRAFCRVIEITSIDTVFEHFFGWVPYTLAVKSSEAVRLCKVSQANNTSKSVQTLYELLRPQQELDFFFNLRVI